MSSSRNTIPSLWRIFGGISAHWSWTNWPGALANRLKYAGSARRDQWHLPRTPRQLLKDAWRPSDPILATILDGDSNCHANTNYHLSVAPLILLSAGAIKYLRSWCDCLNGFRSVIGDRRSQISVPESQICDLICTLINSLATVDQFVSYMAITAASRHCSD